MTSRFDSPAPPASLRSAQVGLTRHRTIEAARTELELHGYEGARIEDIAARAGVAVPTVYKNFGNKRTLLRAAVTAVMAGAPEQQVERQAWWQEQLRAPTAEAQLRLIARNGRRIYDRAGRLLEVLRAAAANDDELATLWAEINEERLSRSRTSARSLAAKAPLRVGRAEAARTLWALTGPELYVLHVEHAGRSPGVYERWLRGLLVAALL